MLLSLLSKILRAVIICLLFNIASFANNTIIVESQSYHPLHIMDQEWLNIALYNGDTATILPQSILDDPTELAQADILIVSSSCRSGPLERVYPLGKLF